MWGFLPQIITLGMETVCVDKAPQGQETPLGLDDWDTMTSDIMD